MHTSVFKFVSEFGVPNLQTHNHKDKFTEICCFIVCSLILHFTLLQKQMYPTGFIHNSKKQRKETVALVQKKQLFSNTDETRGLMNRWIFTANNNNILFYMGFLFCASVKIVTFLLFLKKQEHHFHVHPWPWPNPNSNLYPLFFCRHLVAWLRHCPGTNITSQRHYTSICVTSHIQIWKSAHSAEQEVQSLPLLKF